MQLTFLFLFFLWLFGLRVCLCRRYLFLKASTMSGKSSIRSVQVFGRKKNAVAVAYCKEGNGLIRVNGKPIELLEPSSIREKAYEPILILGRERFENVDLRVRVSGGGSVAQLYAIRQSIAKALVSYYQKCTLL